MPTNACTAFCDGVTASTAANMKTKEPKKKSKKKSCTRLQAAGLRLLRALIWQPRPRALGLGSHGCGAQSVFHVRAPTHSVLATALASRGAARPPPSVRELGLACLGARRRCSSKDGQFGRALCARPRPVVAQAARLTGAHVRAQAHRVDLVRPCVGSCEVRGPRSVASACGFLSAQRGTCLLGAHGVPVVGWQVLDDERGDEQV